jgi:DNA modification methylase
MNNVIILQGNCIETLKGLPAGSVQTSVSSPPYYGLRDYGTAKWEGGDPECKHQEKRGGNGASSKKQTTSEGTQDYQYKDTCRQCGARRIDEQIGLEETPEAFIQKLVEVYREVWRVLKDDGTLWVNIGDSYATSGTRPKVNGGYRPRTEGLKNKDLIGIPWMLAFALRADGWYLRRDIIWYKDNPMPESADDRPTTSHEYIFLLSKQPRYYFDMEAIKEPAKSDPRDWKTADGWDTSSGEGGHGSIHKNGRKKGRKGYYKNLLNDGQKPRSMHIARAEGEPEKQYPTRNKRSVWRVPTKPYKEAHFATYPEDLIEPCILAGTSARGECPTCGKAWERVVEREKGENESEGRPKKSKGMGEGSTLSLGGGSNGWEENGSKTTTIGWKPQCTCYGLPIITDPPRKPSDEKKQAKYDKDLAAWRAQWEELKPQYDQCDTIPQAVLDPFNGSGTTGAVSLKHRRKYVGCELNPKYIDLTHRRLAKVQPILIPGT